MRDGVSRSTAGIIAIQRGGGQIFHLDCFQWGSQVETQNLRAAGHQVYSESRSPWGKLSTSSAAPANTRAKSLEVLMSVWPFARPRSSVAFAGSSLMWRYQTRLGSGGVVRQSASSNARDAMIKAYHDGFIPGLAPNVATRIWTEEGWLPCGTDQSRLQPPNGTPRAHHVPRARSLRFLQILRSTKNFKIFYMQLFC
jgi:hypothetical protein